MVEAVRATAGEPGDERQLHRGSDVIAGLRDHQDVSRVAVNGLERAPVGQQVTGRADAVPGGAELIGGEQAHDRSQVITYRPAEGNRCRAQVKRCQNLHPPSLPGPCRADRPCRGKGIRPSRSRRCFVVCRIVASQRRYRTAPAP